MPDDQISTPQFETMHDITSMMDAVFKHGAAFGALEECRTGMTATAWIVSVGFVGQIGFMLVATDWARAAPFAALAGVLALLMLDRWHCLWVYRHRLDSQTTHLRQQFSAMGFRFEP